MLSSGIKMCLMTKERKKKKKPKHLLNSHLQMPAHADIFIVRQIYQLDL